MYPMYPISQGVAHSRVQGNGCKKQSRTHTLIDMQYERESGRLTISGTIQAN